MTEKHKIILIVDDESAVVDLLAMQLREEGYEVELARDGYEAMNLAQAHKPDLMILDVNLPKMDGFQVCRLLKYDEQYADIPIMMLTSLATEADKQTGLAVGVDVYLTKPYKIEELQKEIKELLTRGKAAEKSSSA